MANIAKTILDRVGGTPLVEISGKLNTGGARVLAKVESFNPGGSAKDRIAAAGVLKPGATIIEPTSGNTGVGLALVSAVKGYHLILTMPETMSIERRKLAAAYGAEIVLTEGADVSVTDADGNAVTGEGVQIGKGDFRLYHPKFRCMCLCI